MKRILFIICLSAHIGNIISIDLFSLYEERDISTIEEAIKNSATDVNQTNAAGETLLLLCCKNRDTRLSRALLNRPDIDVNKAANDGETPLLAAIRSNGTYFSIDTIGALLKKEALNSANNKGETPLQLAQGTILYNLLEHHFTKK